jgi:hypothetical protein
MHYAPSPDHAMLLHKPSNSLRPIRTPLQSVNPKPRRQPMEHYFNSIDANAMSPSQFNASVPNQITLLEHSHPPCKHRSYSMHLGLSRRGGLGPVFSVEFIRKFIRKLEWVTYIHTRNRCSRDTGECAYEHHRRCQKTGCWDPHLGVIFASVCFGTRLSSRVERRDELELKIRDRKLGLSFILRGAL